MQQKMFYIVMDMDYLIVINGYKGILERDTLYIKNIFLFYLKIFLLILYNFHIIHFSFGIKDINFYLYKKSTYVPVYGKKWKKIS